MRTVQALCGVGWGRRRSESVAGVGWVSVEKHNKVSGRIHVFCYVRSSLILIEKGLCCRKKGDV